MADICSACGIVQRMDDRVDGITVTHLVDRIRRGLQIVASRDATKAGVRGHYAKSFMIHREFLKDYGGDVEIAAQLLDARVEAEIKRLDTLAVASVQAEENFIPTGGIVYIDAAPPRST